MIKIWDLPVTKCDAVNYFLDVFIDDECPGVSTQTDTPLESLKDAECQTTIVWSVFDNSKLINSYNSRSCAKLSRIEIESQVIGSLMDIDHLIQRIPKQHKVNKYCQTDIITNSDQDCQTNSIIASIIPLLPSSSVRDNNLYPSFTSLANAVKTSAKPEIELISQYIVCLQNQIHTLNDKLVTMENQVTEHEEVLKQITEVEDSEGTDSTNGDTNVCFISEDMENTNSIDFCTSSSCRVSSCLNGMSPAIELGNGYYLVNGDD